MDVLGARLIIAWFDGAEDIVPIRIRRRGAVELERTITRSSGTVARMIVDALGVRLPDFNCGARDGIAIRIQRPAKEQHRLALCLGWIGKGGQQSRDQ